MYRVQSPLDLTRGLDNASKETTPLHRIFGGYMRTEISCGICRGASTTFQHFQDLLLDIRRSSSLENAMKLFFSSESLEGDDGDGEGGAYRCSNCQKKGFCIKRNYIQIAPKVLCIQLKRFTAMGGKIVKAVAYPEVLDVTPYVFNKNNLPLNSSPNNQEKVPLIYQLTSIVSHCGSSMNSGHYTATAKSSNGTYFEFDDAVVHQVSVSTALSMSAYILIYEMVPSTSDHYLEFTSHKSLSHTVESEKTFGIPPNHPKLVFGSSARHVNGVLPSPVNCSPLPSMKERGKVYFGVKPGNVFAAMALPTASNGRPQGLSESNGVSIKRSELCVNSKANGASPCQTSRNHSKSTLGSQFPYSMTVYEKISKSGLTNEMESDLVDKRTVDHLVPYPVSGDSSDEEEDRRRRKASENRLLKCPAASEMTISGNLTPDATALATKRGWTVAENKRHDSMKYKVSPPSNLPTPSSDSHKASSFKSILKIFDGSSCMDTKGQSPSKCSMIDKDPPSIVKGASKRKSLCNVDEWLRGIEPEFRESNINKRYPLVSTPCRFSTKRPSLSSQISALIKSFKDNSGSESAATFEELLQFPCQSRDAVISISKTGYRVSYNLNELHFADDQSSSESDDYDAGSDPLITVNQQPDETCNFSWSSSSS